MFDFVAVPTYDRPETCGRDTLATLIKGGVPAGKIHVFVGGADKDSELLREYKRNAPAGEFHWHAAPKGLHRARNYITEYFPIGSRVVQCDDDMKSIGTLDSAGKKLIPEQKIDRLFIEAFEYCQQRNVTLWGLSPVANAFYMSTDWKVGLYFAIGQCYGEVITKRRIKVKRTAKDDYERTLRHYLARGAVARIGSHAAQTRAMRGHPGGIQSELPDRRAAEREAVEALLSEFGELVRLKPGRDGFPEIALRKPKKQAG